jgi:hypothetical protein
MAAMLGASLVLKGGLSLQHLALELLKHSTSRPALAIWWQKTGEVNPLSLLLDLLPFSFPKTSASVAVHLRTPELDIFPCFSPSFP